MSKIIRISCIVAVLICLFGNSSAANENVYVDRIFVSHSSLKDIANNNIPNGTVYTFDSMDKTISFYASIGVTNPKKEKYEVELRCVDKQGALVIKKIWKKDISEFTSHRVGNDIIKEQIYAITLDPREGKMVQGQRIPLENLHQYDIKLYFERKLIGLTGFGYAIE